MKDFPQFTKQQFELIIASIAMTSFQLSRNDNLAELMLEFDYAFEFFGIKPSYDKRKLVTQSTDTCAILFDPIINTLMEHYESIQLQLAIQDSSSVGGRHAN